MREKNITRTVFVTEVHVAVYNKDTKEMEAMQLVAYDIEAKDIDKWVHKELKGTNNVILEIEPAESAEVKYTMTLSDFIKYGKEVLS